MYPVNRCNGIDLNGRELTWNSKTLLTLPPVAALVALFHFSCSRRVGADLYLTLLFPVPWPSFQMNHVEEQYKVLCTVSPQSKTQ